MLLSLLMGAKHKNFLIVVCIVLLSYKAFAQANPADQGKNDDQIQTSDTVEPTQPKSETTKKEKPKSDDGLHHDKTHKDLRDKTNHPELEVDTD